MTDDRDPVPPLVAVGLLLALVAWVGMGRWSFLSSSPYPWGIDGYFYPVQLRSLLETGSLHYPSPPMTLWLMTPLAAVGGAIWAVKVAAAVGTALIAVPLYGVSRELGADRGPALAAATVGATAAASFYFSVEFVKNGIGITIAVAALWAILAAHRRPRRFIIAVAVALTIAAWLSHKSAAGIVALGAAPLAVSWLKRSWKKRAPIVAGGALALVIAAFIAPARFIGLGDLGLASDLFGGGFNPRLPVMSLPGERSDYYGHALPLALLAGVTFWLLYRRASSTNRSALVLSGFSLLCLVCAFPFLDVSDPNSLGFRLRLLAFLPLALFSAPLLQLATAGTSAMTRAGIGLAVAGFVFTARPATYEAPAVEQHPALVAAVAAAKGKLPADAVVVTPERRLVFMTTWLASYRAAQDQTSGSVDRRWRLLPLPYMSPTLRGAIEIERRGNGDGGRIISLHPYAAMGLILMPESTWQRVLVHLERAERERYRRWPTY